MIKDFRSSKCVMLMKNKKTSNDGLSLLKKYAIMLKNKLLNRFILL